ncbi:MAG: Toluene-4-sulfonate monooxygenase system iron-sulfur subunit TsaM1 [Alphaproteobacteria bacterium MarineAlpha11_Bin1]|nr:MAG: Toluene-4-sulfonate monooxygenase system iron-sulfur subunit TsaM1 [Alphaproteobacteria bacterium MarineAlpha11_Bin1]|tara:strand:- start:13613 stop:14629 length:1017 start_codon:yes stop_codon:yes gene_type:complete
MTFIKNTWYAAAESSEVTDKLLGRTICGDPVVLFRKENGAPAALEDRCCHRHLPLSLGKRVGNAVQCGYHGLRFDASGDCVSVPGQSRVPPGASVRAYPVIERYRYIWIWPGDPGKADPDLIPDYHWNEDPMWVSNTGYFYVEGNHQLLVDNLLDLSHVQFVHATTLGADGVTDAPLDTRRDTNHVYIDRWIMDKPPPGMFAGAGDFSGNVDRWQLITWTAPTHVVIDAGCANAGTGARDGNRDEGITVYSNHTITPETEKSCHYFWHHARNYRLEDPELTKFLAKAASTAFGEDVDILAAQQRSIDSAGAGWKGIDINADAGVLQARRVMEKMLAAE